MMTPVHWIFILIAICYIIFDIMKFEKNPEEYSKKKKKFRRSATNSVASNAELFDAFNNKPEFNEEDNNSTSE